MQCIKITFMLYHFDTKSIKMRIFSVSHCHPCTVFPLTRGGYTKKKIRYMMGSITGHKEVINIWAAFSESHQKLIA
jgi:hypothetical protein